MCGIIGYTGAAEAAERLLEGLSALEYRGYDSAGIAVFSNGKLTVEKTVGRIENLRRKVTASAACRGTHCGIGHTRWATHGAPSDRNSHPHGTALLQLVHNGIIENYAELKKELLARGATFLSDTDTEVVAVLLTENLAKLGDKRAAIRATLARITGSYALGIVFADEPGVIYATRFGSPLIVGLGEGENFIASDITAVLRYTKKYLQLRPGDIARVTDKEVVILDADDKPASLPVEEAVWDIAAAERGGYPHFMIKEINEEPEAVKKTLSGRITDGMPDFAKEGFDVSFFRDISRVHIVACGTAMYAGCVGKYALESFARLPAEVEVASEFRYGPALFGKGDLVILFSQSGETADTLAALRLAKERGAVTLAIVNVIGSTIAREADHVLYTWAGPEIAVASTKAYTVQAALVTLLAAAAGVVRGTYTEEECRACTKQLFEDLPAAIAEQLADTSVVEDAARDLLTVKDLFYIGRGSDCMLAAEAALKMKEITYTHAEAYAAGELKHGTISLIEPGTPVVAIANRPELYEKMLSNIREVKARGARVIVVCGADATSLLAEADVKLIVPKLAPAIAGIAAATPLQLLAYHVGAGRKLDVDKPRNLAKAVTVE